MQLRIKVESTKELLHKEREVKTVFFIVLAIVLASGLIFGGCAAPAPAPTPAPLPKPAPAPPPTPGKAPLTREQAKKILIEQVIKPDTLDHDVVVYMTLTALKSGDEVQPAGQDAKKLKLERDAWFAWVDLNPLAMLAHDTLFVFIWADSGPFSMAKTCGLRTRTTRQPRSSQRR